MAVVITRGDMFSLEEKGVAITIPVNTVGVMGKGVALRFKREHPLLYKTYREMCKTNAFKIGHPIVFIDYKGTYVLFPTKKHWRNPSQISWIRDGLEHIKNNLANLHQIAMPALGCGNGHLEWSLVKDVVVSTFGKDDRFLIFLYKPKQALLSKQKALEA